MPLRYGFPHPLTAFTIDLKSLLMNPLVSKRLSQTSIDQMRIHSVHVVQGSMEIVTSLENGMLVVYRLSDIHGPAARNEVTDKELLMVDDIATGAGGRFSPRFIFAPGVGTITACAVSDAGESENSQVRCSFPILVRFCGCCILQRITISSEHERAEGDIEARWKSACGAQRLKSRPPALTS